MVPSNSTPSPEQAAMVQWIARIGAVTAEALAVREGRTVASARGRLQAGVRARLLSCARPLSGRPTLYTATPAGLRATGLSALEPSRVSAANAAHAIACAEVAAQLERSYRDHRVMGERELRGEEHAHGAPLASATVGTSPSGSPLLHRPDLVLWPPARSGQLPVAVEVELTIKAPRRLSHICSAWARSRCVQGVLYLAAPAVLRPLRRAIEQAHAHERIVTLELDTALAHEHAVSTGALARTVPGDA